MSVEGAHGDFDQPHGKPLANGLSLSNRQSIRATRYRISIDLMESEADFMVLTGNDLAVDMVCYGSDYLLGITTFAPDLFAERDRRWAAGDASFHELNDDLQYLGRFAFRSPVPAYKHSAAQFLRLRGWIDRDATPAGAPERPPTDVAILAEIAQRLGVAAT